MVEVGDGRSEVIRVFLNSISISNDKLVLNYEAQIHSTGVDTIRYGYVDMQNL